MENEPGKPMGAKLWRVISRTGVEQPIVRWRGSSDSLRIERMTRRLRIMRNACFRWFLLHLLLTRKESLGPEPPKICIIWWGTGPRTFCLHPVFPPTDVAILSLLIRHASRYQQMHFHRLLYLTNCINDKNGRIHYRIFNCVETCIVV